MEQGNNEALVIHSEVGHVIFSMSQARPWQPRDTSLKLQETLNEALQLKFSACDLKTIKETQQQVHIFSFGCDLQRIPIGDASQRPWWQHVSTNHADPRW